MDTIPEALTENPDGLISVEGLARLLEVPVLRLGPLIGHGYIRIAQAHDEFARMSWLSVKWRSDVLR